MDRNSARGVLAALCAVVALLAAPRIGAAQQVLIDLGGSVGLSGWPVGAAFAVTVRDMNEGVIQYCPGVVSATGQGLCRVRADLGGRIEAGDSVTLSIGGQEYSHTVAGLTITAVDPARNRIAGRVLRKKPSVHVAASQSNFDDGWVGYDYYSGDATPDADGRFSLSTKPLDLKRSAVVGASYTEGAPVAFTVQRDEYAPGLEIDLGAGTVRFKGAPYRNYRLLLIDRKGQVKGTMLTNTTGLGGASSIGQRFLTRGGRIARILPGDRIRVVGPWSFTSRVPRLNVGPDHVVDTVHIETLPDAGVHVYAYGYASYDPFLFQKYPRTDADGVLDIVLVGVDLVPGDFVVAEVYDRAGNSVTRTVQIAP